MRKYQQLLLLLISIISVTVLLIYKSENNRLKYVLKVVNFFGRNDAVSLIKIEGFSKNSSVLYEYSSPLPVWQNLGGNVYAYSSFWKGNELAAGGQTISMVVGLQHSIVNFKCSLQFPNNNVVLGKFGFIRVEPPEITSKTSSGHSEKYVIYKFICKTTRDFGKQQPKNLIFVNGETKSESFLPLRNLNLKSSIKAGIVDKSLLTICMDWNNYNRSYINDFVNETTILQYFLHHEIIGIRNFIIYNSNINPLPARIVDMINSKYGIRLDVLPYNFPFELNDKHKNRAIIERDCLMRTSSTSKFLVITELNEYLYPKQMISLTSPLVKLLSHYSSDISRFEVSTRSVCMDARKKILSDNSYYNVDLKNSVFYIFKNEYPLNDKYITESSKKESVILDREKVIVHKYITCLNKTDLFDWRTTVDADHLNFINLISKELNTLLFH